MKPETRNCQNCKQDFRIEPDDFSFYEKIRVPPPTWCPECRIIRRMAWRNDWHLFKKQDARTSEPIFSFFTPEAPVKVYDRDYYLSDAWDPGSYARDIDWTRPFFEQFGELLEEVPLPAHSMQSIVNSEFCTNASYIKNCYYSRGLTHTEDCAYVIWDTASKNCMDSHMTDRCELGYGNVNCDRCYKTLFSVSCEDCQNVTLSMDCVGCSNCVGCVGLRSKSYCIFNVPYTREEYEAKIAELDLGSSRAFEETRRKAYAVWLSFPVKYIHGLQNMNVSGDYIYNSKNAAHCYRVKGAENSKFCMNVLDAPVKDCYDYANWGAGCELMYECLVCGDHNYNCKCCWNCFPANKNLQYCVFCASSADLFGCVSLRKKQYCIFNKQYSKEEYEELVPRLIEHMNAMPYKGTRGLIYRYGDYFPLEFSPYPYNVTAAHEFFPKTKEEVRNMGLSWKEDEKREYVPTVAATDLPDRSSEADSVIVNEVIACSDGGRCGHECTMAFRIIPQELKFLQRLSLPLPRRCPNCRHGERVALRNGPRFWHRGCQCAGVRSQNGVYQNTAKHLHGTAKCLNEFETSYAPERPEIVYCEQCYNAEVA